MQKKKKQWIHIKWFMNCKKNYLHMTQLNTKTDDNPFNPSFLLLFNNWLLKATRKQKEKKLLVVFPFVFTSFRSARTFTPNTYYFYSNIRKARYHQGAIYHRLENVIKKKFFTHIYMLRSLRYSRRRPYLLSQLRCEWIKRKESL